MERKKAKLAVRLLYGQATIMVMEIFEKISKVFDTRDVVKTSEFLEEFNNWVNPEVLLEILAMEKIVRVKEDKVELLETEELEMEELMPVLFAWLFLNRYEDSIRYEDEDEDEVLEMLGLD